MVLLLKGHWSIVRASARTVVEISVEHANEHHRVAELQTLGFQMGRTRQTQNSLPHPWLLYASGMTVIGRMPLPIFLKWSVAA